MNASNVLLLMANSFVVSPGEFGYVLKRQSFLSLQDVLSKCVFTIFQKAFPSSSPRDEIFVHLDLRVQESALQRWDEALSVSSSLHVLSQILPSIVTSLPEDSVVSPFLSLLQKLRVQLEQGFCGMHAFASIILIDDSSLFSQSRQGMLFVRGILFTLLPLDPSLSVSIQAAIDSIDSCLRLAENPSQLFSAAAPSMSCVVLIRALVSLCEAADRHHTSIEVRKNPTRSLLWAFAAVAERGENPVSPEQFKFLNDSVVELGCCYEEFVSARMIDAASVITLLLDALKAPDLASATSDMRGVFLDCFAHHANALSAQDSRAALVMHAATCAISSCPFYASSSAFLTSKNTTASVLGHCKTGHVSLPWNQEWHCVDKISGNVKLLMQIDLCCRVLKLVPAFYDKTAREVENHLCKSHAIVVVRNVSAALDQVNEGCTGIMGMLSGCGHALAKILSPDCDTFVDGNTSVSFDSSNDDGVFPLLVHVVLARLRGGYEGQKCACFNNYSSIFNQVCHPTTHAVLSDYISGKVSLVQFTSTISSQHVADAVVHLDDLGSRLCPSKYLAPMQIPTTSSSSTSEKTPTSKLRKHEVFVRVWDSEVDSDNLTLVDDSVSMSPLETNKELVVCDEDVVSFADYFNFSSTLFDSENNFQFFLFYGERGTGKTFQSIQVVKRIQMSRKSRGLRFHWHLIDCKSPESARSSLIQSTRMDFKIHERFEKRAPPQEVAAALSKYLEGIQ
jgi:hypothetical protein